MHENWKFHHVAVAVRDMEKSIKFYETLGIGPFPPLIGPSGAALTGKTVRGEPMDYQIDLRHAKSGIGDLKFELIEPLEGETPVKEFLDQRGEGIHHLAVGVKDIKAELEKLKAKGVPLVDQEPRIGAGGHKIAFLHPKATKILLELVEAGH